MSESSGSPVPSLQFEHAETSAAPALALQCAQCSSAIHSVYYSANGATMCETCHYARQAAPQGSSVGRMVKSLLAGTGVAIVGAAAYYGIREATGYEIGLVAIALGWGIGKAVLWGSSNRGGRRYQALAVALTYLAIVSTYVPYLFQGFEEAAAKDEAAAKQAPATTSAATSSAATTSTATPAPKVQQAAALPPPTAAEFVIGLTGLTALILAAPFLAGFENAIGILIIAIGLWEAWKITKATTGDVTGPYRVGETS
jgi:hypothetical protein